MTQPHRQPPAARAARRKLALVTWLAAYPTLTALLAVSQALGLASAPLPLRTLAVTLVLVPLMVFVLQPNLMRVANKLRRARQHRAAHTPSVQQPT
jgi:antibiotic biosynthesis monooxygenase (ABM) superfamily enzyme